MSAAPRSSSSSSTTGSERFARILHWIHTDRSVQRVNKLLNPYCIAWRFMKWRSGFPCGALLFLIGASDPYHYAMLAVLGVIVLCCATLGWAYRLHFAEQLVAARKRRADAASRQQPAEDPDAYYTDWIGEDPASYTTAAPDKEPGA